MLFHFIINPFSSSQSDFFTKSKETSIFFLLHCSNKCFSQILQRINKRKYNLARTSMAFPKALKCSEITMQGGYTLQKSNKVLTIW
jgi:hypothetical protein